MRGLEGKPYNQLKVICPYTELLQYATEFFLRLEEPSTQFVYVGDSETSYYELVKRLWLEGQTFIIVEHDIVIWPGALHEMWECPELFCAYEAPYNITPVGGRRGLSYGLGCLKWHRDLISKYPGLIEGVCDFDKQWVRIDQILVVKILDINQGEIHYHEPPVGHLSKSRFPMEEMISRECHER